MHKLNNQQAPNNDCDVSRVCSLSPSLEGVGDGALPSSGSSCYIHRCLQKTRLLPCFWPGQEAVVMLHGNYRFYFGERVLT